MSGFATDVFRVVQEAAWLALSEGRATIEQAEDDEGSPFLVLRPTNPLACELRVYADYPTLCMGSERLCTEMFGPEEKRLQELSRLARALIAGKYEWEHRQSRFLWKRFTQLRGTFHTENGPWTFTWQGAEPPAAAQRRTYEPY